MVEGDLSYAAKTLPAKWDNEAGRITSGAAYAMLSRAMLYAKRWQSAKTAAEEVFKLGYVLMPGKTAADYAKAFTSMRDGNTESILEYNYLVGGPNHSWDKLFMPGGDNTTTAGPLRRRRWSSRTNWRRRAVIPTGHRGTIRRPVRPIRRLMLNWNPVSMLPCFTTGANGKAVLSNLM